MVVAGYGEGNEVGGVDEGDVVVGGEFDAESAGGALVIVDGKGGASEGGGAAVFKFIFRDEGEGWNRWGRSRCGRP